MSEVKRYWISRDTPGSEIPVTSGRMVSVVLASDCDALEASIPARERAAFVAGVGWADDYSPEPGASDQSGEAEAVSRYPGKEAT